MSAGYRSGNMPGEVLFQWFSCCVLRERTQQGKRHVTRVRIDRSMIGAPTNFKHTGHIGSSDVEMGSLRLNAIHGQMQSKGGYEATIGAN